MVATLNMGHVLVALGRPDEALRQYRRAVDFEPDYATARHCLGDALANSGWEEAACQQFRAILELNPDDAMAHHKLGTLLMELGQQELALAECRRAVELAPRNADYQLSLGNLLQETGRYDEADVSTRRAFELSPPGDPTHTAAVQQRERCRQQRALEQALPAVLEGKAEPATVAERLESARMLQQPRWRRYATSARLYARAFAEEPRLADDPRQVFRYNAACAAALAGTGHREEAVQADGKREGCARAQALEWLRSDLVLWKRRARSKPPDLGAAKLARRSQHDVDLAGVRDPGAGQAARIGARSLAEVLGRSGRDAGSYKMTRKT